MAATKLALAFPVLILILSPCQAQEPFRLGNVYHSDMVLQMEPKSAHIWGYGATNAEVTVTIGSLDRTFSLTSRVQAEDSKWNFFLPPQPAGGPVDITVLHTPEQGEEETIVLSDVMFGDVWVCAGESNMVQTLLQVQNEVEEIQKALTYDQIRIFQAGQNLPSGEEQDEGEISIPWSKPSQALVENFSALCYLYGERLADLLGDRPIGLIDASWGQTTIEYWVPPSVGEACGSSQNLDALWNTLIFPLTKMTVRGAIWYQGESNVNSHPDLYGCQFKGMIEKWRDTFVDARVSVPEEGGWAFPFGFVQVGSGDDEESEHKWGEFRWHQTFDHGFAPNDDLQETFMASAIDMTDIGALIAYRDKQTVATRLSRAAKNFLYGEPHRTTGPIVTDIFKKSGVVNLTYDGNIRSRGLEGFSYILRNGTWVDAYPALVLENLVSLNVDSRTTQVAFGWMSTVCEYKLCAVYSDDADDLPGQPWRLDIV